MSPKPPEWITFYAVEGQPHRTYRSSWATRGTGQVATRCHHPDCADGHGADGTLVSISVTIAAAWLVAVQHSATHQPKAS